MSTFEIFWCVVSDMSISSIIVGRRMCRVSAKRWKSFFGDLEHIKNERKIPISTRIYLFWPENAFFDPKMLILTRKYRFWPKIPTQILTQISTRNADTEILIFDPKYRFRPKNANPILPILIQKYRFCCKISLSYLFSCHHHWFNVFARGYFWSVTF